MTIGRLNSAASSVAVPLAIRVTSQAASAACDWPVSYTHLRAHETVLDPVCRLLLDKQKKLEVMLQLVIDPPIETLLSTSIIIH